MYYEAALHTQVRTQFQAIEISASSRVYDNINNKNQPQSRPADASKVAWCSPCPERHIKNSSVTCRVTLL